MAELMITLGIVGTGLWLWFLWVVPWWISVPFCTAGFILLYVVTLGLRTNKKISEEVP